MSAQDPVEPKTGKSFDSAYGFSFAIAIGLLLFIAGLVLSLTLGAGSSIGLIFGIPLIIAGLAVPLFMMRGEFKQVELAEDCPYCGAQIKTTDATIRLECPKCGRLVVVSDMKLHRSEG